MKKTTMRWSMYLAALLCLALAGGARGDDPLDTQGVLRFLHAGLSERTIILELQGRGFSEALDPDREAALRQAGATETLVVAVRRAAAATATAASAPKGGAAPRATAAPPAPSGTGLTFKAGARSVRVPVSVLDKKGQPVLGLLQNDFQITEEGRKQALTYFSGERKPLRVALALDVSTSMKDKMEQVSDALRHFIDLLEPADEIMVITFAADVHVDQDFTSDRDQLEHVFTRLEPAPGTALFDAAVEAVKRVAPGPAEGKAVVLVTDGVDNASQASFEKLRELARRSEVPIFSIGIDGGDNRSAIMRQMGMGGGGRGPGRGGFPGRFPGGGGGGFPGGYPGGGMRGGDRDFDSRPLLDLAEDTGGRAEILKGLENDHGKEDRLKEAVESIAITLRHRYLVGYEPEAGKKGWRKIDVDVDKPSVKVQARKGYYTEG